MNVFGNSSRGSGLDEQNSFWKTEENPRSGWNFRRFGLIGLFLANVEHSQISPYNIVNYKA